MSEEHRAHAGDETGLQAAVPAPRLSPPESYHQGHLQCPQCIARQQTWAGGHQEVCRWSLVKERPELNSRGSKIVGVDELSLLSVL